MEHKILPCGEGAVTVQFEGDAGETGRAAMCLAAKLQKKMPDGVHDVMCAYRSVTVCFDPLSVNRPKLLKALSAAAEKSVGGGASESTVYKIPVCYGGHMGEDLKSVAKIAGISEREVVRRHISRDYLINMIGFLPGFPYLSGLDETIAAPRLSEPRVSIPKGSVGIGGSQTGIYPLASPGGWRLIGRTPVKPYDPEREPAVLYRPGDYIRFFAIAEDEYNSIALEVSKGTYVIGKEKAVR